MSDTKPTIAIIGGGISGLVLGIALNERNIPVTIYEQAHKFGEIGAGVAFTRNAEEAMGICAKGIHDAFLKVVTHEEWPSKRKVWFDFLNGMDQHTEGHQESLFTIMSPVGQNGVHRAQFVNGMLHLIPEGMAKTGMHLDTITETENGKLQLKFRDGTTTEADAVIGCDGIKSTVRRIVVGDDHPSVKPSYTYKYAYRALVPMEKAVAAVGEERAHNPVLWMGKERHVLTYGVDHGARMNLVAFVNTTEDWPDTNKLTRHATREEFLKDFEGFGSNVIELIKATEPAIDIWAIFDTGDNPVPTFNKSRICLLGDAAHATSPHHGAGAGMCIESASVMASLLGDPAVTKDPKTLEAAFATFTKVRKQRTQWLVHHSRRQADLFEMRVPGVMDDLDKIEQEIAASNFYISMMDVHQLCDEAKNDLKERLKN